MEAKQTIKETTLAALADLAIPWRGPAIPPGTDLAKWIRNEYGRTSPALEAALKTLNPNVDFSRPLDRAFQPSMPAAPRFSGMRELKPADLSAADALEFNAKQVGTAYLQVLKKGHKPGEIEGQLKQMSADDKAFHFSLAEDLYELVPSWAPDPAALAAGRNTNPYETLATWNEHFNQKKSMRPVIVAVIDSGFALAGKDVPNDLEAFDRNAFDDRIALWVNGQYNRGLGGTGGAGRICTYDKFGCNVVSHDGFIQDMAAKSNEYGHGTHVAGLCAGYPMVTNIRKDLIEVMPVKITSTDGHFDPDELNLAVSYAIGTRSTRGARIINLSLIGPPIQGFDYWVEAAAASRVLIVAAAGNAPQGLDHGFKLDQALPQRYPAEYSKRSNVITVAAADRIEANGLAEFSNYGDEYASIAAPGVEVPSILPEGRVEARSGTSQAAPLVTLTAALMLAQNGDLTPEEIKLRLQMTADYVPGLCDQVKLCGKLNMSNALLFQTALIRKKSGEVLLGKLKEPTQIQVPDFKDPQDWLHVARVTFDVAPGKDRVVLLETVENESGYLMNRLTHHVGTVGLLEEVVITPDQGPHMGKPQTIRRNELKDLIIKYPY